MFHENILTRDTVAGRQCFLLCDYGRTACRDKEEDDSVYWEQFWTTWPLCLATEPDPVEAGWLSYDSGRMDKKPPVPSNVDKALRLWVKRIRKYPLQCKGYRINWIRDYLPQEKRTCVTPPSSNASITRKTDTLPIIELRKSFQRDVLSPNQWPAYFPLDGKVDRVITTPRSPVELWTPLCAYDNQTELQLPFDWKETFIQVTGKLAHSDSSRKGCGRRNADTHRFVLAGLPCKLFCQTVVLCRIVQQTLWKQKDFDHFLAHKMWLVTLTRIVRRIVPFVDGTLQVPWRKIFRIVKWLIFIRIKCSRFIHILKMIRIHH